MAAVPTYFVWNETFKAYVLTNSPPGPGQKTFDSSLVAFDEDLLERAKKLKERCTRRVIHKRTKYMKRLSDSSKYLRWPPTKLRDTALSNLNKKNMTGDYPIILPSLDANNGTQLSISTSMDWNVHHCYFDHCMERTNQYEISFLIDFCELIPAMEYEEPDWEHPARKDYSASVLYKDENKNMQVSRPDIRPPTLVYVIGRFMTRETDAARKYNLDLSEGWKPTVFVAAIDLNFNVEGKKAVWIIQDYNSSPPSAWKNEARTDAARVFKDVNGSISRLRSVWPALDTKTTFDAAQLTASVNDLNMGYVEDMGRMVGKTAGTWKLHILGISPERFNPSD